MFNEEQPGYKNLRSILAERTNRVAAWVGAGLSVPAGLPTWQGLKRDLCRVLVEKAATLDAANGAALTNMAQAIAAQSDLWLSFQLLQDKLGFTSFRAAIRASLSGAETCPIPNLYDLSMGFPCRES